LSNRHEAIIDAYETALVGLDPQEVSLRDARAWIKIELPDATNAEIVAALCWSARQDKPHPDVLRRVIRAQAKSGFSD
jgi:hypothetical protein